MRLLSKRLRRSPEDPRQSSSWAAVLGGHYHLDAGRALRFHTRLQSGRATFRGRTAPGIRSHIWRQARIALGRSAAHRIRREKEFKTFQVAGRRAVALVHISAANPFRARAPCRLDCLLHHRPRPFPLCACRGRCHRKAAPSQNRKIRRRNGCCHANCNRGWRRCRSSHGISV